MFVTEHRNEKYEKNKIEIKKGFTRKKDRKQRLNLHIIKVLTGKNIHKNQVLKYVTQED